MRSNLPNVFRLGLLAICLTMQLACSKDIATASAQLSITPSSLDVNVGTPGDTSFATFVVELIDQDDTAPIQGVAIRVSCFFLRIVDVDGNLVDPGAPVEFETNENGQVVFDVEVPLGEDYLETVTIASGAANTTATITGTAPAA